MLIACRARTLTATEVAASARTSRPNASTRKGNEARRATARFSSRTLRPGHTEAGDRLVAQEVVADKTSAVGEVARDAEIDAGLTSEVVVDASASRPPILSIVAQDAGTDAAGNGAVAGGKAQAEEAGGIGGSRSGGESGKAHGKVERLD